MAGTTAYPTALDTVTTLPTAATLSGIELDGDGTVNYLHENVSGVAHEAIVALETKIGTGASTPIANSVLAGSATGVSGWDKTPGLEGIAFPATQVPSADANTLDDYEEGTWTPQIADESQDGSGEGQAYANQYGSYTKIGDTVFFSGQVAITNLGTLTAGNACWLMGLPFTARNITDGQVSVAVGFMISGAVPVAGQNVTGYIQVNDTGILLQLWDATTGTSNLLVSEMSAGGRIMVAGHYRV